jgi:uncharacterized membrane protein YkoI
VRITTALRIALAAAALLMFLRTFPANAGDDAARAREGVREGRFVPADSLLDWLEARYFGRAIEVELEMEDGGEPPTYEVEWLTPQNHVIEFEFDAHSGALLETEGRGLEEARRP